MNQGKIRRPRLVLFILISLFVIPFIIAWWMYKNDESPGSKHINHGQLISPPFSITLLKLRNKTGRKWVLLYFNPNACNKRCKKDLYDLHQIRLATGKNKNRVQRILLNYQNTSLSQSAFKNVIRQHVKAAYALEAGTLYVADPLGNVMMSYKPGANPTGIFKDMQRLLKVSQIG